MKLTNPPASFTKRIAALVYDALPLFSIWFFGTLPWVALSTSDHVGVGNWWYRMYLVALTYGYYVLSWQRGGQTLGMRAWRLRVVTEDGQALTWGHMNKRFVAGAIGLACFGLGFFWAIWHRSSRMWHDLASDTVVLNEKPKKKSNNQD